MWGVFAVIALLIVGAFMFYNSGGHGPGTVSSNATEADKYRELPDSLVRHKEPAV